MCNSVALAIANDYIRKNGSPFTLRQQPNKGIRYNV